MVAIALFGVPVGSDVKTNTKDFVKTKCSQTLHINGVSFFSTYDNLKGDPLEIQHPKFENSRLGLIESVRER